MKRTLITTLAAVAAVLAAAYLTGADGSAAAAPQTGMSGAQMNQTMTPAQQSMQQPAVVTEECTEGYILLMPCPVCHTCPVCQANCGTAHALKCCLGNKKQVFNTSNSAASCTGTQGGMSGPAPQQQHIMTNKAEAVKHAAGHSVSAPQMQTDTAVMSIYSIEAE
jgi:hypothetical protein